jgi:hypothetical protein
LAVSPPLLQNNKININTYILYYFQHIQQYGEIEFLCLMNNM